MVDLSVIILSYNTKELTKNCLDSLIVSLSNKKEIASEIIVIDNASNDGSISMLRTYQKKTLPENIAFIVLENKENIGYPRGNNQGIKRANGRYVLLLNSDVVVKNVNFETIIKYLDKNYKVGGLTVKVLFPKGGIDPASHRGFPTPWNSFCYFTKLEALLGYLPIIGKLFGGYHLTYLNLNTIHEIDSPTGAFFLIRSTILADLKGFDEDFFMYGEDLDLSFRIKQLGYLIMYYPYYDIIHYKYQSGLKNISKTVRNKTKNNFYTAMKIFYKKHYERQHPFIVNRLIYFFIDIKKALS